MNAPLAIAPDETIEAVLGPTNTGKTHYAVERMLGHKTGVIGFPLRLLAREVYDRVVGMRGRGAAALITGEEKIAPPGAQYVLATVEAMPLDWGVDFLAVDEIQLAADPDRGYVFTDRLLRARGRRETLFLGADTIRPLLSSLLPKARISTRPRLSELSYKGPKKISRMPARAAVVAFSADNVYAIAELIRRQRGGAAVVMGALSPRTRNAQVELYQNGDVDHLVATDAIGMGLNLDLKHVAFSGLGKYDGRRSRPLTPAEIAQIAGRAGRHASDGSFGVTGDAPPLPDDLAEDIVAHRFAPLGALQWRNARLDFGTAPALIRSLEQNAPRAGLVRARDADDLLALRRLWADPEIREITTSGGAVRRLWDACQIPDFRKTLASEHAALIGRIYRFLVSDHGVIPSEWIGGEIRRLDRIEGDIDQLSRRLAHVRTWTYVANRGGWVEEAKAWRKTTRDLEDRLSDALHARLTQRFVDRRTSVLTRRLKQREALVADIDASGEVTVEGQHLGRIEGFRFLADESARGDEAKTLRAASLGALKGWFTSRADRFYNAPDNEIDVTEQGGLMWGETAVGRLEPGADPLSPRVRAFADEMIEAPAAEKIERRLSHWINRRVAALFEPLLAMKADEAITGLARGVAWRLAEGLGVLDRRDVAADVKALDQDARASLRKHGVRFGQHSIFMPALLKPAPTRLRLVLWGLHASLDEIPSAPPPGLVTIAAIEGAPEGFYARAGYRLAGARAIRIDMLERLADLLRGQDARAGFEATPDMLSITGCTLEQFAELMRGLGFAAESGTRPKAPARASDKPGAPPVEIPPQTPDEGPAGPPDETPPAPPPEPPGQPGETPPGPPAPEVPPQQAAGAGEAPETETYYVFKTPPRPSAGRKRGEAKGKRADKPRKGKPAKTAGEAKRGGERERAATAKRDKPPDPDSPFAVLQKLKDG